MQRERYPPAGHGGRIEQPEHFLQPHGQHRGGGLGIIEADAGAGGHFEVGGGEAVELLALAPAARQPAQQGLRKVDPAQLGQRLYVRQVRAQPVVELRQQYFIRYVGPVFGEVVVGEGQPLPQLGGGLAPG